MPKVDYCIVLMMLAVQASQSSIAIAESLFEFLIQRTWICISDGMPTEFFSENRCDERKVLDSDGG
jgi:hypothetical protein